MTDRGQASVTCRPHDHTTECGSGLLCHRRGIIALVFRCKITRENCHHRRDHRLPMADEQATRELASEAYAIRVLDAPRADQPPAIRQHDGTLLLQPCDKWRPRRCEAGE
jgi:hypothetical protein